MRILVLSFLLISILSFSQNIDEFNKIASGINSSFTDFEIKIGKSSRDRETNFGLERRIYDFETFNILVNEKDDITGIDEIAFLSKKQFENKESWYNICKYLNTDPDYVIIESMINSDTDDLYKTDLKFEAIVDLLRKARNLSDYMYYVVFKKDKIYYQMNMIESSLLIKVSKSYDLRHK